jgi:hypothetical protein
MLKQSNFERNAKKILGFEHFSLKIRGIEKNCLLIFNTFSLIPAFRGPLWASWAPFLDFSLGVLHLPHPPVVPALRKVQI